MSFIKSYNTGSAELIRQFIVPSAVQTILYMLIGGLLLILFNARDIWESLGASIIFQDEPQKIIETPAKNNLWGAISGSRAPQVIFWGLVGMVMYAVVWFVWNILTNLRNDLAADSFVHPRTYNRSKYWTAIWLRKGFFVISVTILGVYIAVFFRILPLLADLSYSAIDNFQISRSTFELITYVVLIAFLIHVFGLLLRISASAWRLIYKDL